jgi:hypothetical protein
VADRKRLYCHKTYLTLLYAFYVAAAIANAVLSIVAFVQYVRFRMADIPEKEKKWQSLHFITLALFILFGVLILVKLTDRYNSHSQI